jgi:hypothetical protein
MVRNPLALFLLFEVSAPCFIAGYFEVSAPCFIAGYFEVSAPCFIVRVPPASLLGVLLLSLPN